MASKKQPRQPKRGARKSRAPRLRVSDVAYPIAKPVTSLRYSRTQIKVTREFKLRKMTIPLPPAVVQAIKATFEAADRIAKKLRFTPELTAYILLVQVARRATVLENGEVKFQWEKRDYMRLSSQLQIGGPMELYENFVETHLENINDVKRAATVAKMPLALVPASDPVGIRPKRIDIFMHSAESVKSPLSLRGKNVSWKPSRKTRQKYGKKTRGQKSR